MGFIEKTLRKNFTERLHGKRLFWGVRLRVFCDGGYPIFRLTPRFRTMGYAPHWGMRGFCIYIFGREINFSCGRDIHNFYQPCPPKGDRTNGNPTDAEDLNQKDLKRSLKRLPTAMQRESLRRHGKNGN